MFPFNDRSTRSWSEGTRLVYGQTVVWTLLDCLVSQAIDSGNQTHLFALLALVAAQFATLAGWLALGDGDWRPRAIIVAAAIVLTEVISILICLLDGVTPQYGDAAALATGYIVTLALPLWVLTAFGWHCRRLQDASDSAAPFQFSLRQALLFTACVATALGIHRLLPQSNLQALASASVAALIVGTLPWAQWFLMLRPNLGSAAWPAFALVLLVTGYSGAIVWLGHGQVELGLIALALHTAALGINLYLFRALGYRLEV